ncbi:hypothetical protein JKP88DRAFT_347053 [Tribonema minus]|uniref:Uncharacterized protein n=1 Tax=Tribonema minus TaxID=303371 RepID=A0A835YPY8_9STRA|nr:hypothetical protein JKP88DRAFT_347053 [Tribonema minus]
MKELRAPWPRWHSSQSAISDSVLALDDQLRDHALWRDRQQADFLERLVILPGIEAWVDARVGRLIDRGVGVTVGDVRALLRQVVSTTTVNITCSSQQSSQQTQPNDISLPESFFLNHKSLLSLLEDLDADVADLQLVGARIPYAAYRATLLTLGSRIEAPLPGGGRFTQPGDTFFAFMVPEVAFEDQALLSRMTDPDAGCLSPRLALALLMVDFANPVYSEQRAQLLELVPAAAALRPGFTLQQLGTLILSRAEAAATAASDVPPSLRAAAQQLLAYHNMPVKDIMEELAAYTASVRARLPLDSIEYQRLAESRRRVFKRSALSEFALTLPVTNIPADAARLTMRADGTVEQGGDLPEKRECDDGRLEPI